MLAALLFFATSTTPALVHGGPAAPTGWAALVHGQPWVCWQEAPGCWQRIPIELTAGMRPDPELPRLSGPAEIRRMGFVDARRLLLVDADGRRWVVRRGDPQPRTSDIEWRTQVPRRLPCSPTGRLPVISTTGWGWVASPCEAGSWCARTRPLPRPARTAGLDLRIGVELSRTDDVLETRELSTGVLRRRPNTMALVFLELGHDPVAGRRHRLARQSLLRTSRGSIPLPAVPAGPLAAAERAALRAGVCTSVEDEG